MTGFLMVVVVILLGLLVAMTYIAGQYRKWWLESRAWEEAQREEKVVR